VEEALALCEGVEQGLFVAGVNLKAEALVRVAGLLEEQGRWEHGVAGLVICVSICTFVLVAGFSYMRQYLYFCTSCWPPGRAGAVGARGGRFSYMRQYLYFVLLY
jgi:hypothetical protein